jgi:proline iminopeptidase
VLGGSGGSTLARAYAERYRKRVSETILWGVTTGRQKEFDWLFRGVVADFFPAEWERLRVALPGAYRDCDIADEYQRLLHDPDPAVRHRAAVEWCMWESATPTRSPSSGVAERFTDPRYALAFARLVTHYVRHNAWLEDENLLDGARSLARIPAVLINGRFDFLGSRWLGLGAPSLMAFIQLVIVDAGHDAGDTRITQELIRATDRFAAMD